MYSLSNEVNVWIYKHFSGLPALAELILLFFPILRKIEKNNESYNRLLPAAARAEIEKNEINKIKRFCGLVIAVRPLISVIVNNYGYIALGTTEINRVYANAPPCAPPEKPVFTEFQIYEILQSLIPPILDELQDKETQLKKEEIRNYVTQKLTNKVHKNPRSYPILWANAREFNIFEKSVKLCIVHYILPSIKAGTTRKNKKAEKIMKDAVAAWRRWDVDIDAELPGDDNKPTTYHDIIRGNTPEPLSILLMQEKHKAEQAALAALTDDEKARLIADYASRQKSKNGLLFEVAERGDCETLPLPENANKYRRKPKPQATMQPLLFIGGTL
jgi:hypothetical protein